MSLLIVAIAQQALTGAIPLAIAGSGELLAQRAGIINVGIEGLMLTGCIAGFAVAALTGNPWLAVGTAIAAGSALAALFAAITILARVDQIVSGMAINLIAVGISGTIWEALQSRGYSSLELGVGFDPLAVDIFEHYGLLWVAIALLAGTAWILRRSRAGIIIAALGDAPDAAAAAGIRVRRWRCGLVLIAGALAGLAGAFLSIMRTHGFVPEMTGGQGFLVLALVIFGRWTALGLTVGCLLFGTLNALQQHGQAAGWTAVVPYQVFLALPYLVALVALTLRFGHTTGPLALNQPWPRER